MIRQRLIYPNLFSVPPDHSDAEQYNKNRQDIRVPGNGFTRPYGIQDRR